MISNPNTPTDTNTFESSSPLGFDLRGMLVPYLKKWYWFALCIAIFVSLAYMKIRYTIPQYNVSSTIMIAQDESVTGSELAAFKDLGLLQNAQESKLENEIQVLKSRTLITNIVNDLKLNVRYFSEGRILEVENYPKSLIEINFLSHDSIVHTKSATFNVRINSSTSFTFLDKEGTKLSDHSFGNTVTTNIGDVVITPSVDNLDTHSGKVIKIVVTPVKFVVEAYRNKLAVFPARGSSIVGISLNDPVREKAKDIINNLVDEYNIATVESKKQISARTANFINERLDLISGDLSEVDDEAAGYKSKFGLTSDVDAQTQRVADIDSRNVQEIAQLSTQINLIESMRRFVLSQDGRYDLIPANLGFADASITNTVTRYNGLTLQRKRLLKTSSEQNPVVVNIDQQIDGLRQVLIGSLNSLKSSIDIRLKSLRTQDQYFSGKLYNAPIREKDLRVIEREQTIKEQLYLYLLQKREEAELTSHITVSSARVIDRASTLNSYPVSPNKKIIYAGALFLGFILPFMTIYLSDLLNVKISSREDLEKVLSMPIIGSIPKVKAKNKIIISKNERSGEAEAFRILRTNLDFLMAGTTKSSGRVIFVTSTISGEGKTMISSNLTKTLSITGKKVIYLGTDLRDPKFHKFVDLPEGVNTKGLTNYIMDTELSPVDIIYKDKEENSFDFIPSGAIPPNPAELLMHDRVGEIFEYLKENYDYVVVDTSPVSLVADTLLIGHFADLCIYIVRENYSDKKLLQIPQNFYKDKRLPNIAVLLNSAGSQAGYNYGYGYGKKS
ncbi:polysaccharide biosynthesis tyrosine autokinase [Aquimarina sp. AD10]|uniref:GumC family protein n=2 Tax=Aquimarina sp. AD10 TaxID=1714849 RepID=UPI000EA971C7|nr:polysaccharide biosynthesis tyrosine autokinase [Aquimarina sp. AD10]RKN00255.1 polysaccharide biosynthesis tyrosine autokinase [Aquimarina sp. AD10]